MVVARYTDLTKLYKSFNLKISAGNLRQGEILGIVGANALGKTTFMRMLAGVEKPDSGDIEVPAKFLSNLNTLATTMMERYEHYLLWLFNRYRKF